MSLVKLEIITLIYISWSNYINDPPFRLYLLPENLKNPYARSDGLKTPLHRQQSFNSLDEEKNGHVPRAQLLNVLLQMGWTCQRSLIWHQCEVTREQGLIRVVVSSTLQRNLTTSLRRAQLLGYWLMFRLTG